MKRLFCLCVALFLVFANLPAVNADVIFEPRDDFYTDHAEECEYHDRSYTANGPNGNVTAYESPESDRVIKTVKNGERIYISYIYQDDTGIQWGFSGHWDDEGGWIPMPYLELIYDYIAFGEEYGHTFVQEEGKLAESWSGKKIYFWDYPGSTCAVLIPLQEDYLLQYDMIYTDENGYRWGRGMYYFGMRDYWVNLDAPDADFATLYPGRVEGQTQPEPSESTQPQKYVPEITPQSSFNIGFVAICVAAVVVVSLLLLVLLKRKR